MVRKIQEVKQDLTNLEEKVASIHDNLIYFYGEYVNVLSVSIKKQLVLAAYQVSTQKYPEQFLKLSFTQREKFQKKIKEIAQNFKLDSFNLFSQNPQAQQILQAILNQLDEQNQSPKEITKNEPEEPNLSGEEIKTQVIKITNPEQLSIWQQGLEIQIRELLDQISNEANQALQAYNILPSKLPSKLLEMAIKAEEKGSPMTGPPNLLNVLIEAKNNDKPEDATITPVTAIHLRLSEIEFSDPQLSNQRHQIRNLMADLATIKQKYNKLTKELAIAQAESAWRSSWYEDN
jgi:hypothetical protein